VAVDGVTDLTPTALMSAVLVALYLVASGVTYVVLNAGVMFFSAAAMSVCSEV
jgi:hypothetical protein